MCTALRHTTVLEHDDLIAIVNGPQPVRNEYTRPRLFFQYTVDVLEEALLRVGVESRSLEANQSPASKGLRPRQTHSFIKKQQGRIFQDQPGYG